MSFSQNTQPSNACGKSVVSGSYGKDTVSYIMAYYKETSDFILCKKNNSNKFYVFLS